MAIRASLFLVAATVAVVVTAQRPTNSEWKDQQANASKAADDAAAKESKMAAVNKVVSMLRDLRSQVESEGEKEAQTYNKFSCFCKDTTADKTEQIQKGSDEKESLTSAIGTLSQERSDLDTTIAGLIASIAAEEKAVTAAKGVRIADLKLYTTNEADLAGAIAALDAAIRHLKASKAPTLVQIHDQVMNSAVRQALMMADALGLSGKAAAAALLQYGADPLVPTENYKFHSDDIIGTLEGLHKDFIQEKTDVDEEEVRAVAAHDAFLQEKADIIKKHNEDLDSSKKSKAQKQEQIGSKSALLSTVAATLLDDQEYMKGLSDMCSKKGQTWDQRSKVRQDELSALTAAITIIEGTVSEKTSAASIRFAQQGVSVRMAEATARSPEAMEAVEAAVEASEDAPSFLQHAAELVKPLRTMPATRKATPAFLAKVSVAAIHGSGRGDVQTVEELIRSSGTQLHSALLTALAGRIAQEGQAKGTDVFAKVKVLIQELIERLLTEATNEAGHKGWCDKSLADARQKRDNAAEQVEGLNGNMAELEATRDTLQVDLKELEKNIDELIAKRTDAEQLRAIEKTENAATVTEAKEGLAAVSEAIDILDKFYKTAAKETVKLSLAQQTPGDDAPDAGFEGGESYVGAQGEAGGVIGMLEVIKSDFDRTISETEAAEAQAVQDHLTFMTDTGKSLAEKNVAKNEKTVQLSDTEAKLSTAEDDMTAQMDIVTGKIKELLELKPVCIDTDMTFDERSARRADELEALKKALCILDQFAQYGEGGLGAAC
jgi:hypothetical protein